MLPGAIVPIPAFVWTFTVTASLLRQQHGNSSEHGYRKSWIIDKVTRLLITLFMSAEKTEQQSKFPTTWLAAEAPNPALHHILSKIPLLQNSLFVVF